MTGHTATWVNLQLKSRVWKAQKQTKWTPVLRTAKQGGKIMRKCKWQLGDGPLWRAGDLGSGSVQGASGERIRSHFLTSVATVQYLLYTNVLSCTKLFYVPFNCGIKPFQRVKNGEKNQDNYYQTFLKKRKIFWWKREWARSVSFHRADLKWEVAVQQFKGRFWWDHTVTTTIRTGRGEGSRRD